MNYNEWYNCTKDLMELDGLGFNLNNFIKWIYVKYGIVYKKPKTWFKAYLLMCE